MCNFSFLLSLSLSFWSRPEAIFFLIYLCFGLPSLSQKPHSLHGVDPSYHISYGMDVFLLPYIVFLQWAGEIFSWPSLVVFLYTKMKIVAHSTQSFKKAEKPFTFSSPAFQIFLVTEVNAFITLHNSCPSLLSSLIKVTQTKGFYLDYSLL